MTAATVRLAGEDTDVTIDGYELFSARRALELLKRKVGRDGLLELLEDEIAEDEIAEGEAFLRDHLIRSAGAEATGTTTLRASGMTAAAFGRWLGAAFAREDVMLAGHPEHYAIHAEPGRLVNIVETLDDQVCSFFMRPWADSIDDVPAGRRSHMLLADGTVVGWIANVFEDEHEGFTVRLSVTLPVTCSPDVVEQHLEHFAVEFRTWILRAARESGEA